MLTTLSEGWSVPRLDGAACAGEPELFEYLPGEDLKALRRRIPRALEVCKRCPALAECSATAPKRSDEWLVEGGRVVFDVAAEAQRRRRKMLRKARNRHARLASDPEAERTREEARRLLAQWRSGNHGVV